jgi:general secretion pathway protein K
MTAGCSPGGRNTRNPEGFGHTAQRVGVAACTKSKRDPGSAGAWVDERGFVLLIVLWTVGVLALMTTTLLANVRTENRLIANLRGAATASAAADAAISATVINLLRPGGGVTSRQRIGGAAVAIRLEDLSGRINPNLASTTMLRGFLLGLGLDPVRADSIAAAIVDWRTPGLTRNQHGAKADQYREAGLPYGPPGRPFEHLSELGAVLGVTPTLLAAMLPHMTLWSTGDPDPGYADGIVIAALRASGAPPVASRSTEARIIAITAAATTPDAPLIVRRAVVRFGYSPDGRAWRVLAWEDAGTAER